MARVVMFVFNDCTKDTRVLREAATLVSAGHRVTIMARPRDTRSSSFERERTATGVDIVRVPLPQGWKRWYAMARYPWRAKGWIRFRVMYDLQRGAAGWAELVALSPAGLAWMAWMLIRAPFYVASRALHRGRSQPGGDSVDFLVRWRYSTCGWARAAAEAAPEADIYHGHDLSGLPGAVAAAGPRGARIVYDSHEVFLESGSNARRPKWVRSLLARDERRWTARAAAMVTVNRSLEAELGRRYHPRRIVVVFNCPPRWVPPQTPPSHLRQVAQVPAGTPIVLYHGVFSMDRGLLALAQSMLEPGLERAHLVLLGFGELATRLQAEAADPKYGGRLHVLPAVDPDELAEWVASADVSAMPNQPATLNERLSTPNKLFESLAAGVPVVTSDFPERRRIVLDDPAGPLGAVCDPTRIPDIARAIGTLVRLPEVDAAELRARCLLAAHERWNWETEGAKLVALYADLTGERAVSPASAADGPSHAPAPPASAA